MANGALRHQTGKAADSCHIRLLRLARGLMIPTVREVQMNETIETARLLLRPWRTDDTTDALVRKIAMRWHMNRGSIRMFADIRRWS